ncbi:MAG: threonine synthase [Liquorilactobacillus ghanensis]|uniref:threonine synthase n=1 Tax=Liquorilactobacillus ghanensis TaxID=399370 RepID=UPI0039ECDD8F
MEIRYQSTRDLNAKKVTASQAILQGLSPDGGLYVPTEIPAIKTPLTELAKLSYQELAFKILKPYLPDFSDQELQACLTAAYGSNFDTSTIAPLTEHANAFYLELFHGPTIAFKDLALQLLPHLMTVAARKNKLKAEIVILTATSGDTGKAAMEGFADVPQTKIIVFYPKDGVSPIQEKQMLTQKGQNTSVFGIAGNFDQAQTNVKNIFNDQEFKDYLARHNYRFSSANSINIGRLLPQIVYYFYAYGQLLNAGKITAGETINFSVPTGNFGDILAGYYAKKMGLPIKKLICASNKNHVLTDFFNSGTYDKQRPFYVTSSPSMDILVSSNLERLLYYLSDRNPQTTRSLMEQLQHKGSYQISAAMKTKLTDFAAGFADENQTAAEIKRVFAVDGTTLDPHTAVASYVAQEWLHDTPTVIIATASPYKFPQAVWSALTTTPLADGQQALAELQKLIKLPYPPAIKQLLTATVKDRQSIAPTKMKSAIVDVLFDH